jgi:hypothetical protein
MKKTPLVVSDAAEAAVLNQLEVRLVRPEELEEWNRLAVKHHYLKSADLVGEQLRYVAEYQGQWMALIGWSAAAYHCHRAVQNQPLLGTSKPATLRGVDS